MAAGSGDNSDKNSGGSEGQDQKESSPHWRKLAKTIIEPSHDPTGGSANQNATGMPGGNSVVGSGVPQRLPGGGYQVPRQKSVVDASGTHPTFKEANEPAPQVTDDAYAHGQQDLPAAQYSKAVEPPPPAPVPAKSEKRERRGFTRTAIDMLVSIGNSLTGKHATGDSTYSSAPSSYGDLSGAPGAEAQTESANPFYDNQVHYEDNEQHDQYGQFAEAEAGELGPAEDTGHHDRVPRTLLDISVLNDITATTGAKKVLKAAEEAKERANEPVKPFIAIETKRKALPCAWKWEEDNSKDRFRYCGLCQAQVYNFAGMELPQAEAIIFSRENRTKAPLYKRDDGKYMTSDCPLAVKKRTNMIVISVAAIFLVVCLVAVMIMMPKPPKTATTDTGSGTSQTSNTAGSSGSASDLSGGSTGGSSATKAGTGGQPSSSASSGASTAGNPGGSTTTTTATGANGGYGPSDSDQSWQWQYDNSQPSQPVQSAPARPVQNEPPPTASQQAELNRLKQEIIKQDSQVNK